MGRKYDIDDVSKLYNIPVEPSKDNGTSYYAQCPLCNDKKFHLNIHRGKKVYYCFRCGEGGSYLDLHSRLKFGIPASSNDLSRYELYLDLEDTIDGSGRLDLRNRKRVEIEEHVDRVPGSDDALHAAYSVLLSFPLLALTDQHRENLHKRGLKDADIERNQYRSFPEDIDWLKEFPDVVKRYERDGIEKIQKEIPKGKKLSKYALLSAYVIGDWVSKRVDVRDVPGFYKVKDTWAVNLSKGMLIPSRNVNGQIVGIQTRTDSGSLRYITLSSSSMPEGVNTNISRAHFPLANPEIGPDTKVWVTEGPLKSDVAESFLQGRNVAIIAILGVSNLKDLRDHVFPMLKSKGVKMIVNVFDMDKFTNVNVTSGCMKLKRAVESSGLIYDNQMWDEKVAREHVVKLFDDAVEMQLPIPDEISLTTIDQMPFSKVCYTINTLAKTLTNAGCECREWPGCKGIDDFLLSKSLKLETA